jgi:hypothetical protein
VSRRLLLLVAGALAFWVVVALPARWLGGGDHAVAYLGTALGLCLVPAAATLYWAGRVAGQDPQQLPLVVLGGTGVRLFGVLLAGMGLYYGVAFFRERPGFWVWLLLGYLFTLFLEMFLLLAGRPTPGKPS